jgi:hypothetical protein
MTARQRRWRSRGRCAIRPSPARSSACATPRMPRRSRPRRRSSSIRRTSVSSLHSVPAQAGSAPARRRRVDPLRGREREHRRCRIRHMRASGVGRHGRPLRTTCSGADTTWGRSWSRRGAITSRGRAATTRRCRPLEGLSARAPRRFGRKLDKSLAGGRLSREGLRRSVSGCASPGLSKIARSRTTATSAPRDAKARCPDGWRVLRRARRQAWRAGSRWRSLRPASAWRRRARRPLRPAPRRPPSAGRPARCARERSRRTPRSIAPRCPLAAR